MKEVIDKLNIIKIKIFCSVENNVKRIRRQVIDWEKIFTKDAFDKALLSRLYKALLKLSNKNINNLVKR